MKRLVKDMYIRDNCHPMKTMLVAWLQLPMWFSMSFALRNMAGVLPMRGGGNCCNNTNFVNRNPIPGVPENTTLVSELLKFQLLFHVHVC